MLTTKITNIAESIRNKTGKTNLLTLDEMPNEINSIKTDPILQDKSIEITENGTTNITADEGYDGLNNVEVVTNVAGSGGSETVEKGFVVNEWDSDGYPLEVKSVGLTVIPSNYFSSYSSGYGLFTRLQTLRIPSEVALISANICYNDSGLKEVIFEENSKCTMLGDDAFNNLTSLQKINLPNSISSIGKTVFRYCSNLELDKLPDSLTTIGSTAFYGCSKLTIKTIPDGVTGTNVSVFGSTGITQISMNNITKLFGSTSSNGVFYSCTGLKAVWIGSAITEIGYYAFNKCSSLQKMFINLPRATVEAMTNYSVAFSYNTFTTDVIVCNDDEGFMTKAEFDAIDWSTYTG